MILLFICLHLVSESTYFLTSKIALFAQQQLRQLLYTAFLWYLGQIWQFMLDLSSEFDSEGQASYGIGISNQIQLNFGILCNYALMIAIT